MGRRNKSHADNRADLRGGGFVGLPVVVHKSDAYRSLGVFERAVLIEVIAAFTGYNNGKIVVSQRQIADALGNGNFRKISRALATLIERGLLDISTESVWKQRLAREYRLTFATSGSPPHTRPATNEYLSWRKNDADDVSAGKGKSADDVTADPKVPADDVTAEQSQKPQKYVARVKSSADDVSALISKPYGGTAKKGALNTPDTLGAAA